MSISLQNIENRVTNLESKHGLKWFFAGRVISDESIYPNPDKRCHISIPKNAKEVAIIRRFGFGNNDIHYHKCNLDELLSDPEVFWDDLSFVLYGKTNDFPYYLFTATATGSMYHDNSSFIWYSLNL